MGGSHVEFLVKIARNSTCQSFGCSINIDRMAVDAFVQCRVAPETKAALRAAAHRQQLSESALLKRMLLVLLPDVASVAEPLVAQLPQFNPPSSQRRARLSVRLTGGDHLLLRERAHARGMAPSSYVSTLIRAHLRAVTPVPSEELRALRAASAELAAIGRNVNQIARELQSGTVPVGVQMPELGTVLRLCKALHVHFQDYLRQNAASWTNGHAPPSTQL